MPVYDVDPDGRYYVAIPNVNLFNDNFRAYDMQVAYNNDYAELIKGWKYRKGILYIPKSAVDDPENRRAVKDGATIAVQLNYAIGGDMDLSKSIPVQVLSDKDEPEEKTVHTGNIFDQENLSVDTGIRGRKDADIKVMLNGSLIPISRDAWTYHEGTGKIDIYVEPGIVSNINIVFARKSTAEKVKDKTVSALKSTLFLEAYADTKVSREQMKNIKTAQGEDIVLDIDMSKMFIGWRGYYNASYMHGASNAKKSSMLALTGWENSVYYLYGGYTTTAGIPQGGTADKQMGPTWAFSSYALAYNVGASDGDTTLDKDTNLTHWNSHEGQSETHKIYYWVQNVYADDLELSDHKWGGGGTNDVNGLGGTNNFAISLPKKINGSPNNLVNTGAAASRNCEDISFDSETLTNRQKQSNTFDNCGSTKTLKSGNYNYWIAASCNHLDEAASDEDEADGNDVFVTCLGMDKDYVILAFVQSNPSYSQNASAIYKFKVESSGFAMIKKTPSRQDVLSHPGYSLAGAVYYLYTDKGCTQRAKDVDGKNIVLTTKANGETNVAEVDPNVTYYAKEITPSPGFELDTNVNGGKGITVTTANDEDHPALFSSTEKPKPAHVTLTKKAATTNTNFLTEAPNNYTIKGAVYRLYTDEACTKQATDFNGNPVELATDASGKTQVVEMLPDTYYAKEVSASKGFLVDGGKESPTVYRIVLSLNHTKTAPFVVNSIDEPTYKDPKFKIYKIDVNGQYAWSKLRNAEYTISYYDVDPDTKDVSGKTPTRKWIFKTRKIDGDIPGSFNAGFDWTTDDPVSGSDDFYIENSKRVLPIGVFTLEETKAPAGLARNEKVYYGKVYQKTNGTDASIEFDESAEADGRLQFVGIEVRQHVYLNIIKKDAETGEATAQGTESDMRKAVFGSLAGAKYNVYYDDPDLAKPELVGTITTDENGFGELKTRTEGDPDRIGEDLELGRYFIEEAEASPGYTLDQMHYEEENDDYRNGQHVIVARAEEPDKETFTAEVESLEEPHHTVISKTDITTGEELPGALLQVIDSRGNVVEEWTSTDEPHDIVALHDETQGLKDGKYTLREITAPYGYDVAEDVEFEVRSDTIKNTVEMKNKPVTIGTTATDTETNGHAGRYSIEETVKDEVRVTGLYEGRQYRISGVLMDRATGESVKDADGEEITAEKEFTADGDEMTIELEFRVDSSQFTRETTTVAFEKLYRTNKVHDAEADAVPVELQKHEDIDDEGQTIHYGGIASTTALDKKSGSHNVLASEHAVVIDTVEYRNLSPEEEYTLEGEFYDKTTGKMTGIKGRAKFRPEKPDGKVEVRFGFDASDLEGHVLVAYETLSVIADIDGEKRPFEIDRHDDPDDEAQTMYIPSIRTTAADAETGEHMTLASENIRIRDIVSYRNLIPGTEYEMTGTLMDKETGKPVTDNGKAVTASERFTPENTDGTVEIIFTFNGVKLAGKKVVAFEKCTVIGVPIAVHADIEDKDQTVKIPKIGTKAAIADKVVMDTVTYEDLEIGGYVLKGWLMDTKTGKKLSGSDGEQYLAISDNDDASGEIVMELPVDDYEQLRGKKITAFEELYVLIADENGEIREVLIAEHKDLKDNGQTVRIPAKSIPPKTGDKTLAWLYLILFAGSLGGIFILAAREYAERRRQHKEDMEMFA